MKITMLLKDTPEVESLLKELKLDLLYEHGRYYGQRHGSTRMGARPDGTSRWAGYQEYNDAEDHLTWGWLACSGNQFVITKNHIDQMFLTVDSRRHGIPFRAQLIELAKHKSAVVEYESQRKDIEWSETT